MQLKALQGSKNDGETTSSIFIFDSRQYVVCDHGALEFLSLNFVFGLPIFPLHLPTKPVCMAE
jgi:hypothetical protein